MRERALVILMIDVDRSTEAAVESTLISAVKPGPAKRATFQKLANAARRHSLAVAATRACRSCRRATQSGEETDEDGRW